MNHSFVSRVVLCVGLATVSGVCVGDMIGVQFQGTGFAITSGSDYPTTAGFVPQSGWNVVQNANTTTGSGIAILDNAGNPAGTLAYSSNNAYGSGNAGTSVNNLLSGYLDDAPGVQATATITSLPSAIAGSGSTPYDVIVYLAGDTTGRGGSYTVNGVSAVLTELASNASYSLAGPATDNLGTNAVPGNYYEFTGITGTTLSIVANPLYDANGGGTWRAPLDGFQVLSVVPEPSSLVLLGLARSALWSLAGVGAYRELIFDSSKKSLPPSNARAVFFARTRHDAAPTVESPRQSPRIFCSVRCRERQGSPQGSGGQQCPPNQSGVKCSLPRCDASANKAFALLATPDRRSVCLTRPAPSDTGG